MEKHSALTLREILDKLAHILAHKQSGTFFIATDANTSCRFALADGKLTHCAHKRDQGFAAIVSLLETTGGSCSFAENQTIPFRSDAAVPHQQALALLGIRIIPPQPSTAASPATLTPAVQPPTPSVNNYFYRGG